MNGRIHRNSRIGTRHSLLWALCFIEMALLTFGSVAQEKSRLVKDRFIVTFKTEAGDPDQISEHLARAHGFAVRNVYRYALRGMVIDLPEPAQQHVLDALRQNPNVDSIVQDRTITLTEDDTSPKGIMRVGAEVTHLRANSGAGVRVAVVDSGIDFQHRDLSVDQSLSTECLGGKPCVIGSGGDDGYGHGTSVAGVIAAQDNGVDLVGVAPEASLVSVRIFDSGGNTTTADVLAGIDYIVKLNRDGTPVHVANMSFRDLCKDNTSGAYISCEIDPDVVPQHTAIQNLVLSGTTVIAATGNDSIDTNYVWPAGFSETVAISALADSNGQPGGGGPAVCLTYLLPGWCIQSVPDDSFASFSNFGFRVDVIAPGADELLLRNGGGTRSASGTSFAAPHAAGVAAIFISSRLGMPELPPPATVKQALITTGECYATGSAAGNVFHGGAGCAQPWPADKDTFAEPLVRADNVVYFREDGSVPNAPTNPHAETVSSSQINLSWTDSSTNEEGFRIDRCAGPGCTGFVQIATVSANVTTYSDTGLSAASTVSYLVRSYNYAGLSEAPSVTSATTLNVPPPTAPGNLTATAVSSSQIDLSWADKSDNESGFRIERCTGSGCTVFAQIATVGANVTSYGNTGLTAGTAYSYRVRAYNSSGDSGYSNTASATTQSAPTIPAAPSNLMAAAVSSTQINLSWKDNSGNETGFKIERCKGSTCTGFAQIATVGANVTSYINTRLSRNTAYRYRVRAYNVAGNSAYSNIAVATTPR